MFIRKTKLITDKSKTSNFILLYICAMLEVEFVVPLHAIWKKGLNSNSKILILASELLISEEKYRKKEMCQGLCTGLSNQSQHGLTFSQPHMNQ